MDLLSAKALALELMDKHGLLGDWYFDFDSAKRRFGCCSHTRKRISLSRYLVQLNGEAEVRDTILHEIAHALAGHKAGHGPVWRQIARSIGASPRRCFSVKEVRVPKGKWELYCSSCELVLPRHRRPRFRSKVACPECCNRHNNGRYSDRFPLEIRRIDGGAQ